MEQDFLIHCTFQAQNPKPFMWEAEALTWKAKGLSFMLYSDSFQAGGPLEKKNKGISRDDNGIVGLRIRDEMRIIRETLTCAPHRHSKR